MHQLAAEAARVHSCAPRLALRGAPQHTAPPSSCTSGAQAAAAPLHAAGPAPLTPPQVHEQLIQFYRGFRHDAHPMAIMCGVVGALSAFYPEVAEVK